MSECCSFQEASISTVWCCLEAHLLVSKHNLPKTHNHFLNTTTHNTATHLSTFIFLNFEGHPRTVTYYAAVY